MKKVIFVLSFIYSQLAFGQTDFCISNYYGNWQHDVNTDIIDKKGNIIDRDNLIINSLYLLSVVINENGLYYDVASTNDDVSSLTKYSCRDFQYNYEGIYEVKDTLIFEISKADSADSKSIKTLYAPLMKDDFEPLLVKTDCINDDFKKMFLINDQQLLIKFQDNYYIFSPVKK